MQDSRHARPAPFWLRSFRVIGALFLREMSTTYGRSPGGYIWAILEPAAGIALLTFVFSLAFRAPPIGNSFPIFYATGILPFMLYMNIAQKIMLAIWFSRPLLRYPVVTYVDAIIARFILNLITQILVFYTVISAILLLFDSRIIMDYPVIILSMSMAAFLGLGVGCLNCMLISIFPVWQRIWAILNRPMFLISCIFFTFESIPEIYRNILWYNPLVHIVGAMRKGFFPTYDANYVSPLYVFGFGAVAMVFGLVFLRRHYQEILN